MAKHTPGPWSVSESVTGCYVIGEDGDEICTLVNEAALYIDVTSDGVPIYKPYRAGDEGNANARLIAAAPEMLDLLREAIGQLNTWANGGKYPKDDSEVVGLLGDGIDTNATPRRISHRMSIRITNLLSRIEGDQ